MAKRKAAKAKSKPLTAAERALLRKLMQREAASTRIESPRMRGRTQKAEHNSLARDKRRVQTSDGEYCYIRLGKANPATQERVKKLVESGEYIFERTDDDVTVFRYREGSRYQRKRESVAEMTNGRIMQEMIRAACDRNWTLYREASLEFAYRIKAGLPPGQAEPMFQNLMTYLHLRISRRGGPGNVEINQALARLRADERGTQLFLPTRH